VEAILMADRQQARKRRSTEEVAALVLAAAEREFEAAGYAGATTSAIARRAGVTEAQIFRLYPSKQALFRAAIFEPLNRHFAEFQARVLDGGAGGSQRELARRYIAELQAFIGEHSRMLMSLIVASAYDRDSGEGPAEIAALQDYFAHGAATMAARVGGEARVDPSLMVRVSFAAVLANALFADWLFPPGLASAEAIREATAAFVIDGIRANADPALD
jgi:AcrR family transcriptional regulator